MRARQFNIYPSGIALLAQAALRAIYFCLFFPPGTGLLGWMGDHPYQSLRTAIYGPAAVIIGVGAIKRMRSAVGPTDIISNAGLIEVLIYAIFFSNSQDLVGPPAVEIACLLIMLAGLLASARVARRGSMPPPQVRS
jgi:hypothetical protein